MLEFDSVKQVAFENFLACFACLHNNILEFDSVKQVLFEILACFARLHNNILEFWLGKTSTIWNF